MLIALYTSVSSRCAFMQNDGQPRLDREDVSHGKLILDIREMKMLRTTTEEAQRRFVNSEKEGSQKMVQHFVNGRVK